jgi:hypothetical protein
MNIQAGIVDQHVRGLATRLDEALDEAVGKALDETARRSAAFLVLCVKTVLDLGEPEALERVTEGGNDFGVDAIDVGDVLDGEFTVTLFQTKYSHKDLEGKKNFPEEGVEAAVGAVRYLFDPSQGDRLTLNPRLESRMEEVRSLLLDGYIPRVRVLLCSNGLSWKRPEAQGVIEREGFPAEQVSFEHVSHETLVRILQASAPVQDTLQFAGKAIVEDLNFSRALIGRLPVSELARLMESHGDRLLERNIRRYLGLHSNRVNTQIMQSLRDPGERANFFFYNNGVTLICKQFTHNGLQQGDHRVRVEGLQIINGGQTSRTIHELSKQRDLFASLDNAFVLVRLYQVGGADDAQAAAFVRNITVATNSQNPVDLRDLRSNDDIQKGLEASIGALGFTYRRQRTDVGVRALDITAGVVAEAVLAVWRRSPQRAKFMSSEHFGKLYETIFHGLNGAQALLAVMLYRVSENKRRRPPAGSPEFVRYASCFVAMLMGESLLSDMGISSAHGLDHRNFQAARDLIEAKSEAYFQDATNRLAAALSGLYGGAEVSLQRLSATFRRGDLLDYLRRPGQQP